MGRLWRNPGGGSMGGGDERTKNQEVLDRNWGRMVQRLGEALEMHWRRT